MQVFAWDVRQHRKPLESQRGLDEIAQNHTYRIGFRPDEERRRLIKVFLRKPWIAPHPSNDHPFEITRQCQSADHSQQPTCMVRRTSTIDPRRPE